MSYRDRLRSARYFSPSGNEFLLQFDTLSRSGAKKAAISEAPDRDLPDVQDLGMSAQTYPLLCYFSGADYDQIADRFYAALCEKGPAMLSHPRWGDLKIIATKFSQKEGFVEGVRRAEFEIDFVKIGEAKFPTSSVSMESDLQAEINTLSELTASGYESQFGGG